MKLIRLNMKSSELFFLMGHDISICLLNFCMQIFDLFDVKQKGVIDLAILLEHLTFSTQMPPKKRRSIVSETNDKYNCVVLLFMFQFNA